MIDRFTPNQYKGVLNRYYPKYVNAVEDGTLTSKPINSILRELHKDYSAQLDDPDRVLGMIAVYNAVDPASLEVRYESSELPDDYDPLEYIIVYDQWGYYWGGNFVFTKEPTY